VSWLPPLDSGKHHGRQQSAASRAPGGFILLFWARPRFLFSLYVLAMCAVRGHGKNVALMEVSAGKPKSA
jgi:hypothetical protein